MSHYTGYGPRSTSTPQNEPIPGSSQVKNSAGGYSFAVDDMMRLQRFLVLGSSGGSYYASERKLTKENLEVVEQLLKSGRGKEVVDKIVEISDGGRGVSNDPALFALARCCACDVRPDEIYIGKDGKQHRRVHAENIIIRRYALAALPKVARTGTHLLHFMEYVKQFRGDGPALLKAVEKWYNDKPVERLAYQVLKYQNRDGWAQRDVLRTVHPHPLTAEQKALYHWITKGWEGPIESVPSEDALGLIWAFERAKKAESDKEVTQLIKQYRLPREAVPTEHLKSVRVWEALLEDMPIEAMTRNLATMTRNGVLVPMSELTSQIAARLRNREVIHKARLHPIKILAALMTYQGGKSARGKGEWTPIQQIVDALNDAFYMAFKCVEPSKKRIVLALDVSGSMNCGTINGIPGLTPRVASAALALVTAATEPRYTIMAFSQGFIPLNISPKQRLDDVVKATDGLPFEGTDCARPMLWAMEKGIQADAFVILTDSETWQGNIHASQALQQYRQKFNIPAKLVVVGMVSNGFSIADPNDLGMLDVVGMDTATPEIISSFIADRI